MKKYKKGEKVPMVFHYIFRFFILPVSIVANILLAAVAANVMGAFTHVAFVILTIINVGVAVMLFVGLGKFTPRSYYLAIGFGMLMLLEGGLSLVASIERMFFSAAIISGVIALIGVFESIYYIKRADLFDGHGPSNRKREDQDNGESIPVGMSKAV